MKQLGSRFDRVSGDVGIVHKYRRTQHKHHVILVELIGKRLLRRQQSTSKQPVSPRKGPAPTDPLKPFRVPRELPPGGTRASSRPWELKEKRAPSVAEQRGDIPA